MKIPMVYACRLYESLPENIFSLFMMAIDAEKKKRILRQKIRRKAEAMLVGEVLAKLAIKEQFEINIKSQRFERTKMGKPYLSDCPDVHFSISHSDDFVVCAVSDHPVGADVEKVKKVNPDIFDRVCSQSEKEEILKSAESDREFIKLWTKKEAVIKKEGQGISKSDIKNCLADKNVTTIEKDGYYISWI